MTSETFINLNSYLTFKLGSETFAASVGKVIEILELPHITKIPQAPAYMPGVINLRGHVLPLIDTRLKFGLSATEFLIDTCVVVLEVQVEGQTIEIGALVDSVQEVIEIKKQDLKQPPSIGAAFETQHLTGMYKHNDCFVLVLDTDQVFSSQDIISLKSHASKNETLQAAMA